MAWWIPAAVIGSKLIGHFAGSGGRKKEKKAYKDLTRLGEEFRSFDPMSYAKDAAQAQWNMVQTPLAEALGDYRAGQVEHGRLGTGFSFQGEDRMMRDVYQNYTDQLASRSMEAGGMKLGALASAGDVYAARYDMGAREEDKEWKKWSGFGSDALGAYLWGREIGM